MIANKNPLKGVKLFDYGLAVVQTALKKCQTPGQKKKKTSNTSKGCAKLIFLLGCLIYSLDSPVVMFVLLELCCEVELNNFTHQSVFNTFFMFMYSGSTKLLKNTHY